MSNDDETEEKKDLTKITDLSEFLHEDDPETDRLLKESAEITELTSSTSEDLPSIDDLDNEEEDLISEFAEEQEDGQDESPPSFELEEDSFEERTEPQFSTDDETDTSFGSDSFGADSESTEFDSGSDFSEESTDFSEESSDFTSDSADFGEDSTSFGEEAQEDSSQFSEEQDEDDQFNLGGGFSEETEDFSEGVTEFEEEESTEDTETMDFGVQDELSQEDEQVQVEEEQEEEPTQTEDFNFTPEPTQTEISAPQVEASTTPPAPEKKRTPPENFQDLRDFGNSITYGKVSLGGNPPFSIIVRGIVFEEDAEDILIILREHGLADDSNEKDMKIGLEQGSIIISQISEYSAIYLCHRLRRFNVSIEMGLSDEIYQSKSYKQEGRGLVSKYNLKQNISEDLVVERSDLKTEDILVTTTPLLEGHRILRYVDIVSSHTIVKEDELHRLHQAQLMEKEDIEEFENADEEDKLKKFSLGLNQIYHELGDELKNEAFKIEANAIVGLNYQITPLLTSFSEQSQGEYKITCTGNAVWVSQD